MSLGKFALSSSRRAFFVAFILTLAVGALASGIGIVFQGFETDTSLWFNWNIVQEIYQEPSGYTNGGYASGIASASELRRPPSMVADFFRPTAGMPSDAVVSSDMAGVVRCVRVDRMAATPSPKFDQCLS